MTLAFRPIPDRFFSSFRSSFATRGGELPGLPGETVVLGKLIFSLIGLDPRRLGVIEGEPLGFIRPASSADNASFRDANRLTGAPRVTVNRAVQGHWPIMRMESRRRCLYAARRS
jgi:hypothetical protein